MPNFSHQKSGFGQFNLALLKPLSPLRRMFLAAILLRCPHCGCGSLYAGYYALQPSCRICGTKFEPDGGEWTGALWLSQWFGLSVSLGLWAALHFSGVAIRGLPLLIAIFMVVLMTLTYRNIKGWWIWLMYMTGFVSPTPVPQKESGK